MTATEMAKKIGTRGTYKVGGFILNVKIKDLQDISGEGTMCLITASGAKGGEWIPIGKIEEEKEQTTDTYKEPSILHYRREE